MNVRRVAHVGFTGVPRPLRVRLSFTCGLVLLAGFSFGEAPSVLKAEAYEHYIDSFNASDNELYAQYVPNSTSWQFLKANIPLLDLPDKQIEQTYYFRWWTYRKHVEKTPEGFVITEFLPRVPWAGQYNTISAAAAHHIYEGRWLADPQYIRYYARFWLSSSASPRKYSFWIADALFKYYQVTLDKDLLTQLFPRLLANYESWEAENLDANGLFWQEDGRDGMELSICGALSAESQGYRATINSYLYGDSVAISKMAGLLHQDAIARQYRLKAQAIKANVQRSLWDQEAHFFKVLPRGSDKLCDARELHGYTPWYFNMPDDRYSIAWQYLMEPKYFFAKYGPTTAEQDHRDFQISYQGHECQWNGPSWPYSTAITLTAAANLLNNYRQTYLSKSDYVLLLKIYSNSQQRVAENGQPIPWIDENLNPYTGDWIARTRLKSWANGTWSQDKGGPERGKDYNHSTFADLIITGLMGIRPRQDNRLIVNPLISSAAWGYFCIDRVRYHGKAITVLYDRAGTRYNRGAGFMVFVDGKRVAWSPVVKKVTIAL